MRKRLGSALIVLAGLSSALGCQAATPDNQLTPEEKRNGWILLFDGQTTKDWMTTTWEPCPEALDDGALNPDKCPNLGKNGWDLVYERPWENFIIELDFRISPRTNSGVMVRISPLKALPGFDVEYNGLEVQIEDSKSAGFYDTGAIYDLLKPSVNAMKPTGEWNHLKISCDKNLLDVWLNGQQVNHMNLDQWTRPYERPDGTEHKFNVAWKYHSRSGYIGLQKHGGNCWFKNIKLKPLD